MRGYGGYYDGEYDYDEFDGYSGAVATTPDTPGLPKALDMDYMDYSGLEIVYQSTSENTEVLLNTDGKLLICDACGDIYDYNDWTEVFGEIDGAAAKTTALVI